jgi:putative endonuclease
MQVRVLPPQHFDRLSAFRAGEMSWFVYLLLCDQKTFYTGITTDLNRRVKVHKLKHSFFTKRFSEVKIVYFEKYHSQVEARRRERQIKGWSKAKKKTLVSGNTKLLQKLSKST